MVYADEMMGAVQNLNSLKQRRGIMDQLTTWRVTLRLGRLLALLVFSLWSVCGASVSWAGLSLSLSATPVLVGQTVTADGCATLASTTTISWTGAACPNGSHQKVGTLCGSNNTGPVTMTAVGSCTFTIHSDTCCGGGDVSKVATVNKGNQTIVNNAPVGPIAYNDTFSVTATVASGLPVTVTGSGGCSGTGTGTVTMTMISPSVACTVTYTQNGDANWNAATNNNSTSSTSASKANQTITVGTPAPASASYGGTFNVAASAIASGGVFIAGSGGCTGSGTNSATMTMNSYTTACTVTYTQNGDVNYNAATNNNVTNTTKVKPTISVTTAAPLSAAYNSSFPVAAFSTCGLSVSISGTVGCSGSTSGAPASTSILMTSGTSDCTVTYTQSGSNANCIAADAIISTTTASKISQNIAVTLAAPASAAYNSTFNVAATATSGLGVAITTAGGCSGSGTNSATITMTSGTTACTVAYNQAGNTNYLAAAPVSSSTNSSKISQTITVTAAAPTVAGNGSTFAVAATASSGLGVAITTAGSCSGSGTGSATITMTADSGVCTVLYNQAGNTNYTAAAPTANYVAAMVSVGSGCYGEGVYTSLQFNNTGGYIGWACNAGDYSAPGHSIGCSPSILDWSIQPGGGLKGHVLQTALNPGKTFKIQLAPGSSTYYNILNTTDATCIASGNGVYEYPTAAFPGTRQGSASSAGYLVAIQDTATVPTAYCDYTATQTKWKINPSASYVTFETAGYPGGGCMGTDGFGLSRVLTHPGTDNYGNWGDSWMRNASPSCSDNGAKMTCGGYQPLPPNHVRFEFDASTAFLCQAPTVTIKVCTNAAPAVGGTDSCNPYAGYMILTPSASKGAWSGLTSSPTTGFIGTSSGITLAHTALESTSFSYSAPLTALADPALECYDTSTSKRVSCTAAMTYNACVFDAVEKAASVGSDLYTKLAGTAFDFDVVGTSVYAGNLTVDLVDTSTRTACQIGPAPAQLATVTFTAPSATSNTNTSAFSAGRVTYTTRYDNAASKVGVRITDARGICYPSSDVFSIRPASFGLAVDAVDASHVAVAGSSANASGSQGGSTGMIILATAKNSADVKTTGYVNTPALNPAITILDWSGTAISALPSPSTSPPGSPTAAQTISWASGSGFGAAVSGISAGTFYYNDFGTLTFPVDGIFDNTFTVASSDQSNNDCISGSTSNVLSSGKYGCNIGHAGTLTSPRFSVDHYEANARFTASSCDNAGGQDPAFVYMGDTGLAVKLDITAMNADSTQMGRMWSDWTSTALPTLAITADSGGAVTLDAANSFALPNPPTSPWKSKASTLAGGFYSATANTTTTSTAFTTAFVRGIPPAAETAPKDSFKLTMTLTDAVDGGKISKLNGAVNFPATTAVSSPITRFRFGMLKLDNAYGSELLPLFVPVRAMYWNGSAWVVNNRDSCTQITVAGAGYNLAETIVKGPLTLAKLVPTPSPLTLTSGVGSLRFAAPGVGFNGSADIALNLGSAAVDVSCNTTHPATTGLVRPWLRGKWCGTTYTNDPNARISFGLAKSGLLYMREKY